MSPLILIGTSNFRQIYTPDFRGKFQIRFAPFREQKELLAKGAFTLAQFQGQLRTKLARLVMKKKFL
jgi:hypothetical protein